MSNKPTLNKLTQISNKEESAVALLNENFEKIEKAIEDSVSRSGVVPTAMLTDLDMGSKSLINLGEPKGDYDAVRYKDVKDAIENAADYARKASVSAVNSQNFAAESAAHAVTSKDWSDVSKRYADGVVYGVQRQPFIASNWAETADGKFELRLDAGQMVFQVFRRNDDGSYTTVEVDIEENEEHSVITTFAPFEGYLYLAARTLGTYVHEQTLEAEEWVINHNLGKYPVVVLVDSSNVVQIGTIQYTTLNQVRVTFTNAINGKAYLS